MNTNQFKALLCFYAMGAAGCNKIENPSYMDGGGDKPKEVPALKSSISIAHGSSNTSRRTATADIVNNSILFAEKSLRVAEEKVKRAEHNLNMAKDIKDSTSRKLQNTTQSNRNVSAQDTVQRLIAIAKAEDDSAGNNLRVSEEKVRRTKENLKNAEYALELAKKNKRKT